MKFRLLIILVIQHYVNSSFFIKSTVITNVHISKTHWILFILVPGKRESFSQLDCDVFCYYQSLSIYNINSSKKAPWSWGCSLPCADWSHLVFWDKRSIFKVILYLFLSTYIMVSINLENWRDNFLYGLVGYFACFIQWKLCLLSGSKKLTNLFLLLINLFD